MIKKTTIIALILLSFIQLNAQRSILISDTTKREPAHLVHRFTTDEWNASNFADEKDMKWFKDAKYGMFIHFGISTYIGKDLSWGMCYTRKTPDKGHGPIPDSVWTKYPEKFVFDKFDAKVWVDIALKTGIKYIVVIAKHHDGFHLWNTKYSDFNIMKTPFGRDYLKELADECHSAGLKFGIYYSQRDWYHPDYSPVDPALIDVISKAPYFKAKPGVEKVLPGSSHQKYIDYQFNVVRELCSNYGKIDVFWFDANYWNGMFTADMWESEKLTRMIRQLQPGIIINNRASLPGDFDTPEQRIGAYQSPRPWESCMTLCETWSWSNTPVKSLKTLVKMLTATADGNGNILLSWGPKWDGSYDPAQVTRLEELGEWLKKYGHTIYETKGGPWYPANWGGSTYRDNKSFLHITSPTTRELILPPVDNKIISAKCLTSGVVKFSQRKDGIKVDLSKVAMDTNAVIIEFTFKNTISKMAATKSTLSKFSDPIYGNVISNAASVKMSSVDKNDNPAQHPLLFSKKAEPSYRGIKTRVEKNPSIIIDLAKVYSVTGVNIKFGKNEISKNSNYIVEVSEDANKWTLAEKSNIFYSNWEVTVSRFNAGIQLPGVSARFVRIRLEGTSSLELAHVFVYGK